jgi:hydroxyacylglutathione hydrolase
MVLKRFYHEGLAHASYLVGCPAAEEAIVIDPNRDAEQYIRAAENEDLRIAAVIETHIHADLLSGARELAAKTGATLYLSDEGGPDWKYEFASDPNVRLVRDGDSFRVGSIRFDVIETPGHTPEHIALIVTDEASGDLPLGAFTGDFIFVGDVGRPDLLERAAKVAGTMEAGARQLFRSITAFRNNYPDHLLLWPSHGAGSACGKALGGVPVSSLGYEKAVNWALKDQSEEEFVAEVLSGQPDPPRYFATMKVLNKQGPAILGERHAPPELPAQELQPTLDNGTLVVDIRDGYACCSSPQTLHIPYYRSFVTWAGWLLPYDQPIYLLADSATEAGAAAFDLSLIGIDDVAGWFPATALDCLARQPGSVGQIDAAGAFERSRSQATLLDVRRQSEYDEGHVPGALHIPLGHLPYRVDEVPRGRPLIVHCRSGVRSVIATSILRRAGFENVINVTKGFLEYESLGLPVEAGENSPVAETA